MGTDLTSLCHLIGQIWSGRCDVTVTTLPVYKLQTGSGLSDVTAGPTLDGQVTYREPK